MFFKKESSEIFFSANTGTCFCFEDEHIGDGPQSFKEFQKNKLDQNFSCSESEFLKNSQHVTNKKNVEEYIQKRFICKSNTGKFHIAQLGTLNYVSNLIDMWNYSDDEIRYILSYEKEYLEESETVFNKLLHSDPVRFLLATFEHDLQMPNPALSKKELKKRIEHLKTLELKNLSGERQGKINRQAAEQLLSHSFELNLIIDEFRAGMLAGYHPLTLPFGFPLNLSLLPDNVIDIFQGILKTKVDAGFFEYAIGTDINEDTMKNLKEFDPSIYRFFSTPSFYVGYDTNKNIIFKIRNPQIITTNYMRNIIEKVYSRFRSSLGVERSKWGEVKGSKREIDIRNERLRQLYGEKRSKNQSIPAEKTLEEVINKIGPKYGYISLSRAKRIIYSKQ